MSDQAAHQKGWQIFEVIVGFPFLVAFLLQWGLPLSFPEGWHLLLIFCGSAFVISGLFLVFLTRREFARSSQPTDPGQPTTHLITGGVFCFSRNPLYLGGFLLLMGIALAINSLWNLIFLFLSFIACHYILVLPEERYLLAHFGDEYKSYRAIVHRWLGRGG
jgi:protein-S-isoprenylcysteine O-methyltransferase Ste14